MSEFKAKTVLASCAAALVLLYSGALHADPTLDVLHWWTSASERKAADYLKARLAEQHVEWHDAAIAGGAGVGAVRVLKTRVLANDPPAVAQLIGPSIAEWNELGLLTNLNPVARQWDKQLFPTVWDLIRHRNHVVAAPLGIHRINTLFYNQRIFDQLGLQAPRTPEEFKRVALRLQAAGITPLIQSTQPWQVGTLFETLLLMEGGPQFYREAFVKRNPQAFQDARMGQALARLHQWKTYSDPRIGEASWSDAVKQLQRGQGAMLIMGDWVKGELLALGSKLDTDFSCTAVPGTAEYHLYSIDSLVMFKGSGSWLNEQETLAQLTMQPAVQAGYNQLKGSVPVRRDTDPKQLDRCARSSWETFAKGSNWQAPSLVHRMAADENFKNAVVAQIHQYYLDDKMTVTDIQQRLAGMVKALNKQDGVNDNAKDSDR